LKDYPRPLRRFAISFRFDGRSGMEFVDRLLTCADCGGEFIFTAGEQLFFLDKQFKNDPKRCKPCKSRRSAQQNGSATTGGPAAAGISRTETRTECSECGVSTTVPFKPTQGRPVLCRQCFKNKRPVAAGAETATPAAEAAPAVVVELPPSPADLAVATHTAQSPAELAVASHAAQA
jgi:CxxC-x17-CxxC domain-containing protein